MGNFFLAKPLEGSAYWNPNISVYCIYIGKMWSFERSARARPHIVD